MTLLHRLAKQNWQAPGGAWQTMREFQVLPAALVAVGFGHALESAEAVHGALHLITTLPPDAPIAIRSR